MTEKPRGLIGRREFVKKTAVAGVGTALAMHSFRVEVYGCGSGSACQNWRVRLDKIEFTAQDSNSGFDSAGHYYHDLDVLHENKEETEYNESYVEVKTSGLYDYGAPNPDIGEVKDHYDVTFPTFRGLGEHVPDLSDTYEITAEWNGTVPRFQLYVNSTGGLYFIPDLLSSSDGASEGGENSHVSLELEWQLSAGKINGQCDKVYVQAEFKVHYKNPKTAQLALTSEVTIMMYFSSVCED